MAKTYRNQKRYFEDDYQEKDYQIKKKKPTSKRDGAIKKDSYLENNFDDEKSKSHSYR